MAPPRKPTEDEIVNVFIDMDEQQRESLMKRLNDAHAIVTRVEGRAGQTLFPVSSAELGDQKQ